MKRTPSLAQVETMSASCCRVTAAPVGLAGEASSRPANFSLAKAASIAAGVRCQPSAAETGI